MKDTEIQIRWAEDIKKGGQVKTKNNFNKVLNLSDEDFVTWVKIILSGLKEKRQNDLYYKNKK